MVARGGGIARVVDDHGPPVTLVLRRCICTALLLSSTRHRIGLVHWMQCLSLGGVWTDKRPGGALRRAHTLLYVMMGADTGTYPWLCVHESTDILALFYLVASISSTTIV